MVADTRNATSNYGFEDTVSRDVHCENCGRRWMLRYTATEWWPYTRGLELIGKDPKPLLEPFVDAGASI